MRWSPGNVSKIRAKAIIELRARLPKSTREQQLEARGWRGGNSGRQLMSDSDQPKCPPSDRCGVVSGPTLSMPHSFVSRVRASQAVRGLLEGVFSTGKWSDVVLRTNNRIGSDNGPSRIRKSRRAMQGKRE